MPNSSSARSNQRAVPMCGYELAREGRRRGPEGAALLAAEFSWYGFTPAQLRALVGGKVSAGYLATAKRITPAGQRFIPARRAFRASTTLAAIIV
jgi:hypothetical protein